ncbi:IS5 family transposase [Komagataeibacter oboediens]|uniref:IS5 family transposase n=1 Tax=Komagataeibacter oboediens TaxID=65958 RepID=A0ABS5SQR7_9PROT|nr:IS5 family transposase [Komagataeibacter oboediens]MBL7232092.1 IS5 family transposase [Komagataeibacter oboediens]MBT0676637.1 IS5 family transposase [Komagataeibacter oboediens]MBT0679926.1 IS5 family transposase [Komagataeibacter oboediens]MBV1825808.1 IS5 family transposase [Komagataeibacter oboediens]
MRRYGLSDSQWKRIKDLLPGREGHVGGTAADNRLFVEVVLYRYRAGIPWRDLPTRFGDRKNVHRRLRRWCEGGVIERIFRHLAADRDNDYMMIDSTIVRAHQHSAGRVKKGGADQAIGRSRGGLTSKIHAIVDAAVKAVALSLTPGQRADITETEPLLDEVDPKASIADRAYDADLLIKKQITPVIPSRKNRRDPRKISFHLYKNRNIIERFFARLKSTFLAAVQLVSAIIGIN